MKTYSQFVVEIANSKHIHPEAFVRTKRINSDLLAHFQELVSEDRVTIDLSLVFDCEFFQTRFEL